MVMIRLSNVESFFILLSGFSGTTLYESWLGAGWNVGWTLAPILLLGVLDQDLRAATLLHNPRLYLSGGRKAEFSIWKMAQWISNALIHSLLIYLLCYYSLENGQWARDGRDAGLVLMGTVCVE